MIKFKIKLLITLFLPLALQAAAIADWNLKLLEAARSGNLEQLKEALANKATINARNNYQYTPLHYAAIDGNTEKVKALIEAKATIDARDNIQKTPLHYAARYGNTEALKLLLDVGSNSKLLTKNKKTIFNLISDSWIEPSQKAQLTKIIKDHQIYQGSMLIELPKYFADKRNLFNIPAPIAMIITLYAFGICEIDLNKEGNKQ